MPRPSPGLAPRLILIGGLLWAPAAPAQDCRDDVAPPPAGRFIPSPDGTVRDSQTGLIWKQCAEGLMGVDCKVGEAVKFRWKGARAQAAGATFAGQSDWRLPDRTELESLVRRRCYGIDIDVLSFPNTPAEPFWTSSPSPYYRDSAWTIHFGTGVIGYGTRRDSGFVRLVRDSR